MKHTCATCELAKSATWADFERKIREQYSEYRKAGGEAFVAFWIPHTTEDQEGHRYVNCPGSVSFHLRYDAGETILTFYDEVGEIDYMTIPWQDDTPGNLGQDLQNYVEQPWLNRREANSVLVASSKAIEMLLKLDEDPGNASFAMTDWVMKYE